MKIRHVSIIIFALLLGALVTPVLAEDMSSEEMVEKLIRKEPARRLRGGLRGVTVEGRIAESGSLNLYINFEYNSAQLTQDAKITLDQLATAISDRRLKGHDFLIAGHTDAVGPDAYNQKLSERRAGSVKKYLVSRHGITNSRLIDKGFGESRLLNPSNPIDGANRRVQIVTLSIPEQ